MEYLLQLAERICSANIQAPQQKALIIIGSQFKMESSFHLGLFFAFKCCKQLSHTESHLFALLYSVFLMWAQMFYFHFGAFLKDTFKTF